MNFKNGTKIKIDIESENNRNLENILKNGNSYHNKKPKVPSLFQTQIVERINEDTKKGKTNDTKKKIHFSVEKETTLLGKNDNQIKNNQPRVDEQLNKESKKPNENYQKLNNEINNKKKSKIIENLTRISVEECYISLCKMIETIANVKLKYCCYNCFSGNSAEKYLKYFNKNIGEIVGIYNGKFLNSKLNSIETSEELICLIILFRIKFFNVIGNYINDLPFTFTISDGDKIELKPFKNVENKLIPKYREDIKYKINEILKAKGRLRAKKNK